MRERPILFSGEMVRAILAGRKTQTRRVVRPQPHYNGCGFDPVSGEVVCENDYLPPDILLMPDGGIIGYDVACPYGAPQDMLWVRETWQPIWADPEPASTPVLTSPDGWAIGYPATDGLQEYVDYRRGITTRCKPGIHMPRWASRITLRVTSVRVERLQSITDDDAIAEGISRSQNGHPEHIRFAEMWDSINGKRASWASNPWTWVVGFERMEVPT